MESTKYLRSFATLAHLDPLVTRAIYALLYPSMKSEDLQIKRIMKDLYSLTDSVVESAVDRVRNSVSGQDVQVVDASKADSESQTPPGTPDLKP